MTKRLMVHMCDDQFKELKAYLTQFLFSVKDLPEYHILSHIFKDLPGTVLVTLLHTHLGQLGSEEIGPTELVDHFEMLLNITIPNPSENVKTTMVQLFSVIDNLVSTDYLPVEISELSDLYGFDMDERDFKDRGMTVIKDQRVTFWSIAFNTATDILVVEPIIEELGHSIH